MLGMILLEFNDPDRKTFKVRLSATRKELGDDLHIFLNPHFPKTSYSLYRLSAYDASGCRLFHERVSDHEFKISWNHPEFESKNKTFSIEYEFMVRQSELKKFISSYDDHSLLLCLNEFVFKFDQTAIQATKADGHPVSNDSMEWLLEIRLPPLVSKLHTLFKDVSKEREKFYYEYDEENPFILIGDYESDGFAIDKAKFYMNHIHLQNGEHHAQMKKLLKSSISFAFEQFEKAQLTHLDKFFHIILNEAETNYVSYVKDTLVINYQAEDFDGEETTILNIKTMEFVLDKIINFKKEDNWLKEGLAQYFSYKENKVDIQKKSVEFKKEINDHDNFRLKTKSLVMDSLEKDLRPSSLMLSELAKHEFLKIASLFEILESEKVSFKSFIEKYSQSSFNSQKIKEWYEGAELIEDYYS
tara:strand:+ start:190574 stop:191818 length:1245 start_codon:yes stop_codon:yes gene_type:complete